MALPRPDFGRYADDYRLHRRPPPASLFDRLDAIAPFAGAFVADLGTGPGPVALEMAARGATVVGVDISEGQIAAARVALEERGLAARCTFRCAPAEDTGLLSGAFDLVTAVQCWRWFDPDAARREVRRLLRVGGRFAIVHYDYLARPGNVGGATEAIVLRHNPGWTLAGKDGLYAHLIDSVAGDGLRFVEQFCYDYNERFTHEGWRGRMRTCNGVGSGALPAATVAAFDRDLAAMLRMDYPAEPLAVPHRVFAVIWEKER
jgi:SAM-dependent methyltransferase